jgi:hypothetical protein
VLAGEAGYTAHFVQQDVRRTERRFDHAKPGSQGVFGQGARYVGDGPGKLLIVFAPAGKMEAFFRDNAKPSKQGEYLNDAAVYRAYGLELLGPPLS